jgi:hypothetical protein
VPSQWPLISGEISEHRRQFDRVREERRVAPAEFDELRTDTDRVAPGARLPLRREL